MLAQPWGQKCPPLLWTGRSAGGIRKNWCTTHMTSGVSWQKRSGPRGGGALCWPPFVLRSTVSPTKRREGRRAFGANAVEGCVAVLCPRQRTAPNYNFSLSVPQTLGPSAVFVFGRSMTCLANVTVLGADPAVVMEVAKTQCSSDTVSGWAVAPMDTSATPVPGHGVPLSLHICGMLQRNCQPQPIPALDSLTHILPCLLLE